MKPARFLLRLSIFVTLLASACGVAAVAAPPSTKLVVVTTVSPLTNIIYNIGGSRIALTGIIPEGTDSHTFEPAPSSAQLFAQADVVFVNGLHLEEPTRNLAEANLKPGADNPTLEANSGDVRYDLDFRSIYARLADTWLQTDSVPLLGASFRDNRAALL